MAKLHSKLQRAERTVTEWSMKLIQYREGGNHFLQSCKDECSTEWAQNARDMAWQSSVTGVTYPALPEQMMSMIPGKDDQYLDPETPVTIAHSFIMELSPEGPFNSCNPDDHYREGPYKPFLGEKKLHLRLLHFQEYS